MKTVYAEGQEFDQLFEKYSVPECAKRSGNGYLVNVPEFNFEVDDKINAKFAILAGQGAFSSFKFTGKTEINISQKSTRIWRQTGQPLSEAEYIAWLSQPIVDHWNDPLVGRKIEELPALFAEVTGNAVMAEGELKEMGYPDAAAAHPTWVRVCFLDDLKN